MTRTEWLEKRQAGIGSSDAPCLVGVGYRNASDVFRDKTEPVRESLPTTGVLARGMALEQIVADRYTQETGVKLVTRDMIDRHPEREWQMASVDRWRLEHEDGHDAPVELKTVAGFGDEWGPDGSSRIPDGYFVQVQHQLGVVGNPWAHLAALDVIGWTFRIYSIRFDPEFFGLLSEVEHRFLTDHVRRRRDPGPEWEEKYAAALVEKIPKPEGQIELPEIAAEIIAKRNEFKSIKEAAEEAYRSHNAALESLLGDALEGVVGSWKVKRISVKGSYVPASYRGGYSYLMCRESKPKAKKVKS